MTEALPTVQVTIGGRTLTLMPLTLAQAEEASARVLMLMQPRPEQPPALSLDALSDIAGFIFVAARAYQPDLTILDIDDSREAIAAAGLALVNLTIQHFQEERLKIDGR